MAAWSVAVLKIALALVLVAAARAAPNRPWTFGRRFGGRGLSFEPQPVPAPALGSVVSRLADASSQIAAATAQLGESVPGGYNGVVFGSAFDTGVEVETEVAEHTPTEPTEPSKSTDATETAASASESAAEQATNTEPEPKPDPTPDATPEADPAVASAAEAESSPSSTSAAKDTSLLFPDQLMPLSSKSVDVFVPECDGVPFMALNPETERCQFLMMRTDCPEGEWFILDRDTREAACRPLPCPGDEVLFNGECRPRDDPTLCPEGMVVLANEYGDASCDCAVRHVYWPLHDRCYPAFRQGPCHVGQYLTVGETAAQCTPNVCVRDGAAFWTETKRCYRLRDETNSPCELGRLDVGVDTLELECVEKKLFAIFDLPVVRCSRGSKLDYGGRCKRELYQKFRSTFSSRASPRKKCPEGFIAGASGRCLKAAKEGSKLG